jgi:hypothetical protein
MVLKRKRRILFTDARAEASYRCQTCGNSAERTVKYP